MDRSLTICSSPSMIFKMMYFPINMNQKGIIKDLKVLLLTLFMTFINLNNMLKQGTFLFVIDILVIFRMIIIVQILLTLYQMHILTYGVKKLSLSPLKIRKIMNIFLYQHVIDLNMQQIVKETFIFMICKQRKSAKNMRRKMMIRKVHISSSSRILLSQRLSNLQLTWISLKAVSNSISVSWNNKKKRYFMLDFMTLLLTIWNL